MAIPIYPDTMDFAGVKELENQITFLVNSTYLQGNLYPSFSAAYDFRGAWMVGPSANYTFEPFRFKLAYSSIMGNFTGMGFYRDRDQVTFIFTYLLN
ncbi:MAG: hypothetical protein AB1640_04015, partial [bacterium]